MTLYVFHTRRVNCFVKIQAAYVLSSFKQLIEATYEWFKYGIVSIIDYYV